MQQPELLTLALLVALAFPELGNVLCSGLLLDIVRMGASSEMIF